VHFINKNGFSILKSCDWRPRGNSTTTSRVLDNLVQSCFGQLGMYENLWLPRTLFSGFVCWLSPVAMVLPQLRTSDVMLVEKCDTYLWGTCCRIISYHINSVNLYFVTRNFIEVFAPPKGTIGVYSFSMEQNKDMVCAIARDRHHVTRIHFPPAHSPPEYTH